MFIDAQSMSEKVHHTFVAQFVVSFIYENNLYIQPAQLHNRENDGIHCKRCPPSTP